MADGRPPMYENHARILSRGVTIGLALIVAIALLIGTLVIAGVIADNRTKAVDAAVVAQQADRAAKAALRAANIADELSTNRRIDFARTDYRACLVDEHQDQVLAGLLQASLDVPSRRRLTPEQERVRARFQRTADALARPNGCERIPAMQSLTPAQRRAIVQDHLLSP